MKLTILILSIIVTLIKCEPPQLKRPIGYPIQNLPFKINGPLRTIMIQIRNGNRLPPGLIKSPNGLNIQRLRPIKIIPHTKHSGVQIKRPANLYGTPKPFYSSPPGPNTGEYVFEKPISTTSTTTAAQSQPQIVNGVRVHFSNAGPIHTIPAPNLGSGNKFQNVPDLSIQNDNHIHLTDGFNNFHQATVTPFFHQYQVTEDTTNDQTIRDPISGHTKYFAPDPDPALPTHGIRPASDPFSRPSNSAPLPIDVATSASLNQQYYQFINPIPQQQLPDTYGLPINGQPQLQQHLLQQQASQSVYNPTYLVSQSNNLFNQHQQQQQQQQLFRPEPNYVSTFTDGGPINYQTQYRTGGLQTVASPGQLFASSQFDQNQLNDHYTGSESQNSQSVAQFLDSPQSSSKKPFSEPLTAEEFSNLYNLEQVNGENSQQGYDFTYQQNENDKILTQANQELLQSQELNPHEQHQKLVEQQLNGNSQPMRIYYPDEDNVAIQHRSDDFSLENISTEKIDVSDASRIISGSVESVPSVASYENETFDLSVSSGMKMS